MNVETQLEWSINPPRSTSNANVKYRVICIKCSYRYRSRVGIYVDNEMPKTRRNSSRDGHQSLNEEWGRRTEVRPSKVTRGKRRRGHYLSARCGNDEKWRMLMTVVRSIWDGEISDLDSALTFQGAPQENGKENEGVFNLGGRGEE